jgi:hypothetical protein
VLPVPPLSRELFLIRAVRFTLPFFLASIVAVAGCEAPRSDAQQPAKLRSQQRPSGPIQFTDVTEQAGIHFKHNSGAFGKKYLPETMGSGVCFLDYDNDGWQDILFVNSMDWPEHKNMMTRLRM